MEHYNTSFQRAIVHIRKKAEGDSIYPYSTGFFVHSDGWIVTDQSCVVGAEKVEVLLFQEPKSPSIMVEGVVHLPDDRIDTSIALIKIDGDGFPILEFGDSNLITIGQELMTTGCPLGLDLTFSFSVPRVAKTDIQDSKDGQGRKINLLDLFMVEIRSNPGGCGWFGAPLLDISNKVLGVIVCPPSLFEAAKAFSVARPSNIINYLAFRTINRTDQDKGGYFGLSPHNMESKVTVLVISGGPAHQAGIRDGDIILEISNKRVTTAHDVHLAELQHDAHVTVPLLIVSPGEQKPREVLLTPTSLPKKRRPSAQPVYTAPSGAINWAGATVSKCNMATRMRFKLPSDTQGLVVEHVQPKSTGSIICLQPGDILVSVNDVLITTTEQLKSLTLCPGHPLRVQFTRHVKLWEKAFVICKFAVEVQPVTPSISQ